MTNHGPAFTAFRLWLFAQTWLLWFGAWRLGSWCTALLGIQVLCRAQATTNRVGMGSSSSAELKDAPCEHMRAKVTTASFSPDSTRLVTGSEDCCGRVWDVLLAWLVQLVGGPSAQLWVVSRLSQQLGGEWKMCCLALGPWGLKLSFQAPVGSSFKSHAHANSCANSLQFFFRYRILLDHAKLLMGDNSHLGKRTIG
jgi:hypothetical protein